MIDASGLALKLAQRTASATSASTKRTSARSNSQGTKCNLSSSSNRTRIVKILRHFWSRTRSTRTEVDTTVKLCTGSVALQTGFPLVNVSLDHQLASSSF